jgi:aminocarboxymuconate-semialdehyde decarboxylase
MTVRDEATVQDAGRGYNPRPLAVDVHAHLFPQSAVRAEAAGEAWFGSTFVPMPPTEPPVVLTGPARAAMGSAVHREPPELRLEYMDRVGVTTQVISVLPPLYRYDLPPDVGAAAARAINDEIAGMHATWPDRFLGLATLPLQDTTESLRELDRAMAAGLSGFAVGTHVDGRDLDDPALRPVFRRAGELGCFVLCHPAHPRAGVGLRRFYLSNVVGNPLETALAFTSLVLGGVLDEAPGLRVCFVHGGGYITTLVGRLGHAYRVRPETTGSAEPPEHYLSRVWFDSLTHDPVGLAALVGRVGAGRVLLGSDYPADMGADDPIAAVDAAGLTAADRDAVVGANAVRLLRPGSSVPASDRIR